MQQQQQEQEEEEEEEERYQPFPLTDLQSAYWVGRTTSFGLGSVGCHFFWEFDGFYNINRLEKAVNKVIKRHDMLHAVILPEGMNKVLKNYPEYMIKTIDLSSKTLESACDIVATERERMIRQVFDPTVYPLFELLAVKLPEGAADAMGVSSTSRPSESEKHNTSYYKLLFDFDHLMVDLRSLMMFFSEWYYFYEQPDAILPTPSSQFRDYVVHIETMKNGPKYSAARDYWFNRVETIPPAPPLPARQPGTNLAAIQKPTFSRATKSLDARAWSSLRSFASKSGATPFVLMLTVYASVLSLWADSKHFTINISIFNTLPGGVDAKSILGDFTSSILFEYDNRADKAFTQLCKDHQIQFANDLGNSLISGVEVLREKAKRFKGQVDPMSIIMPVVFTSVLNVDASSSLTGFLPMKKYLVYLLLLKCI